MDHRGEQVKHRGAPIAAAHQRPPERQRADQERHVLQAVYQDGRYGGVEQNRGMPQPDDGAVPDRRWHGAGQRDPGGADVPLAAGPPEAPPQGRGKGPQEGADRARQGQQRRSAGDDDFVLDHVCREQVLAHPVQWRNQGTRQQQPAGAIAADLPGMNAATRSGMTPEPRSSKHIEAAGQQQRDDNPWIEGPRRCQVRVVSVRERFAGGKACDQAGDRARDRPRPETTAPLAFGLHVWPLTARNPST